MNLIKFIDYSIQESREEQQALKKYSVVLDSETQALGIVLNGFRFIMKWVHVPVVLIKYALVCIKALPEPLPVYEKKLDLDKGKKLEKLGMKGKK